MGEGYDRCYADGHEMVPGGFGHAVSHCKHCMATEREVAFALGPVCPSRPRITDETKSGAPAVGRFYTLPFSFEEPIDDAGAYIRDANGATVAMMMWPGHAPADEDAAVAETYEVARRMVAAFSAAPEPPAGVSSDAAQIERMRRALEQCAAPYFWMVDGFRADASTPAHKEAEIYRRKWVAQEALRPPEDEPKSMIDVFERVTKLAETLAGDVPITAAARAQITEAKAKLAEMKETSDG